jgi:hypothetical protein
MYSVFETMNGPNDFAHLPIGKPAHWFLVIIINLQLAQVHTEAQATFLQY